MQSQSVRSAKRPRAFMGVAIPTDCMVQVLKLVYRARDTAEVGSRTTRQLRNSCNGVFCVARQRLVTKFFVVAWRHRVMLACCKWPPVQSIWRFHFCSFSRDTGRLLGYCGKVRPLVEQIDIKSGRRTSLAVELVSLKAEERRRMPKVIFGTALFSM